MHALWNIPWKLEKKFRLLSSFLTFMNRVEKKKNNNNNNNKKNKQKKTTNKETNKTHYNSL